MSEFPSAWCPQCHAPGEAPDPRTEQLEVCGTHYRRADLPGSADALVTLSWDDGGKVETAAETRAACAFIHAREVPQG